MPYVPGYTPEGPDGKPLTPIDPNDPSKGYHVPDVPGDPSQDTNISYVKNNDGGTDTTNPDGSGNGNTTNPGGGNSTTPGNGGNDSTTNPGGGTYLGSPAGNASYGAQPTYGLQHLAAGNATGNQSGTTGGVANAAGVLPDAGDNNQQADLDLIAAALAMLGLTGAEIAKRKQQ